MSRLVLSDKKMAQPLATSLYFHQDCSVRRKSSGTIGVHGEVALERPFYCCCCRFEVSPPLAHRTTYNKAQDFQIEKHLIYCLHEWV